MHTLLRRQLRKLRLEGDVPTAKQWAAFLKRVDGAYEQNDQARYLRQRGQSLAEKELRDAATHLERARDEALAATRTKSAFLANMSHELRTPLNGIIGMSHLLQTTALNHEQSEYARGVKSCGEALLSVVNDILDFSKLEAVELELEHCDFDMRALIEAIGDVVCVAALDRGLELVLHLEPSVPRFLRGDEGRLRQILLNLVTNAIKFTEVGEVVLEVTGTPTADGHTLVQFRVRDSGIGIPAEAKEQLFTPFTQVDASTTRRFGGTGLGLAISAALVERMGGTIRVESTEGVGSTFEVQLTFEIGDGPPEKSFTADLCFAGLTALVVDDNVTNRALLAELLGNWGFQVEHDRSGSDAIARIDANPGKYSVVVVDFQMPGMNGQQFATLVRAQEGDDAPPMVLATSSPSVEIKQTDLFAAVLHKPLKQSRLRQTLAEVLNLATPPAPEPVPAQVDLSSRVLLVEDNRVNQMIAVRMLERAGHVVDVAENGRNAVEWASSKTYDLILMDCQMPELDGFGATRAIRQSATSNAETPIVALTASVQESDRQRCLSAGMTDHLAKPIRAETLNATLKRHLGGSKESP